MFINHSPERITVKGYKGNDCTMTAIGNAAGLSYDLARKVLQTAIFPNGKMSFVKKGPRTKHQFSMRGHVKRVAQELSVNKIEYVSDIEVNRHYKNPQSDVPTIREFAKEYNKGIYLVIVKNHIAAVIDGKLVDTWDSGERLVEVAFEIDIKKAQSTVADIAKFYRMTSDEHILKNHKESILKSASADKSYPVSAENPFLAS